MKTTTEEVARLLTSMIASANIFSVRPVWNDDQSDKLLGILGYDVASSSIYLRFEQSFGCECSLSIDFHRDWQDRKSDKFATHNVKCQLSCPATSRSVSESVALIALHTKVLNLAALIETTFSEIVITDRANPFAK